MPNKTPKPPQTYEDVHGAPGNAATSYISQMIGQQLEAEEEMPPEQPHPQQSLPQPLPPMPSLEDKTPKPQGITIAGNNFTPGDVEHLVTTAQEPPTEFQNEVQAELDRLQQARARKT